VDLLQPLQGLQQLARQPHLLLKLLQPFLCVGWRAGRVVGERAGSGDGEQGQGQKAAQSPADHGAPPPRGIASVRCSLIRSTRSVQVVLKRRGERLKGRTCALVLLSLERSGSACKEKSVKSAG